MVSGISALLAKLVAFIARPSPFGHGSHSPSSVVTCLGCPGSGGMGLKFSFTSLVENEIAGKSLRHGEIGGGAIRTHAGSMGLVGNS